MPASLPKGYLARPASSADAQEAADLINSHSLQIGGDAEATPEWIVADLERPGVDPQRDTRTVRAPDGALVGMAQLFLPTPHVRLKAWDVVHPLHRGLGIETFLAEWLESCARESLALAPDGAQVVLQQDRLSSDSDAIERLILRGYRHVRTGWRMERDLRNAALPMPQTPVGMTIRPMRYPDELPAVVATLCEGFRGHWGWVERPMEDELADWRHYFASEPDADPTLWFVALAGERMVATCACHPSMGDDPDKAYIFGLAVLPDWRRRGIALALLRTLFRTLQERGKRVVGLQVDSQNETGATRLYTRAGMRVTRQTNAYELLLRSGRDPSASSNGQ